MDVKKDQATAEENLVMFPSAKNYRPAFELKDQLDDPLEDLLSEFEELSPSPEDVKEQGPKVKFDTIELEDSDELFEAIGEAQTRIDYFLREILDNIE